MNTPTMHALQTRAETATDPLVPRLAVLVVAGVLAAIVAAVGWVRLTGVDIHDPAGQVVAQAALRFADRPDGGVDVIDVAQGRVLATVQGEQGFLRGVLRGLARERKARGIGAAEPFVLSRHADGRLQLTDPATGQLIELASFGPDNAAVFLRWLPGRPGAAGEFRGKDTP